MSALASLTVQYIRYHVHSLFCSNVFHHKHEQHILDRCKGVDLIFPTSSLTSMPSRPCIVGTILVPGLVFFHFFPHWFLHLFVSGVGSPIVSSSSWVLCADPDGERLVLSFVGGAVWLLLVLFVTTRICCHCRYRCQCQCRCLQLEWWWMNEWMNEWMNKIKQLICHTSLYPLLILRLIILKESCRVVLCLRWSMLQRYTWSVMGWEYCCSICIVVVFRFIWQGVGNYYSWRAASVELIISSPVCLFLVSFE